jgi:S1-C subfamily serine protease
MNEDEIGANSEGETWQDETLPSSPADPYAGETSDAGSGGGNRGRKRRAGAGGSRDAPRSRAQGRLVHSCIVKLIVQRVEPNYAEPWRCKSQVSSSGTGFLMSGRRVITNAHVIRNSTHVRARRSVSPVMFSCTVEWVSIPLDLAVLSVNDVDAFFGATASAPTASDMAAAPANDGPTNVSTNGDADIQGAGLPLSPLLPGLDENVTCVGFPTGGQQISVTRGVVSRVDVNSYGVLRIQIDAAINPGNSGGPVFDERGRVIGIASSHLRGGSNIGYIIPTEVLLYFLGMARGGMEADPIERSALNCERTTKGMAVLAVENEGVDVGNEGTGESGSGAGVVARTITNGGNNLVVAAVGIVGPRMVPGVAGLGMHIQTLENKALRKRLGLRDGGDGGGVRISSFWSPSPVLYADNEQIEESDDTAHRLMVDDVLLTIDGIEVGQDGTIPLSADRPHERIGMSYLMTRERVGHKLELGIVRAGRPMTIQTVLRPNRYLCPVYDAFDAHSSYLVCGGCVFVPLSWPYIRAHKKKAGFPSFGAIASKPANGAEQVIILSKVLADEINVGYHHKRFLILSTVNGSRPKNMRDLIRAILRAGNDEENLEFRAHFDNKEDCEQFICLNVEEAKAAEGRILKQHMVAQWCSDDVVPPEMRDACDKDDDAATTMVSFLEKCI